MKLTANFDSLEFDIHEPFPARLDSNRKRLAELAQWLRNLAGSYGKVTSAYRSPQHNAEVNGSETSQHMKGEAIDIVFPLASLRTIANRVLADVAAKTAPAFGQIIFYADRGHIHISLPMLGARNGEIRSSDMVDDKRVYPMLVAKVPALPGGKIPDVSLTATTASLPLISPPQIKAVVGGGGGAIVLLFVVAFVLRASARAA